MQNSQPSASIKRCRELRKLSDECDSVELKPISTWKVRWYSLGGTPETEAFDSLDKANLFGQRLLDAMTLLGDIKQGRCHPMLDAPLDVGDTKPD